MASLFTNNPPTGSTKDGFIDARAGKLSVVNDTDEQLVEPVSTGADVKGDVIVHLQVTDKLFGSVTVEFTVTGVAYPTFNLLERPDIRGA